ncbi:MAG: hypothetical protein ACJ8F1_12520 [Polyangia bacterium]|jgi:hypothetical protein
MRTSIAQTVALVCVLALGTVNAGCSFIFVESVPSDHARLAYFDCTSTYGLAVADGVIALSGGIAAGAALSESKQEYSNKNNGASRNAAAGGDIAIAGILAGSAVYGIVQATRCDRAKDELKARIFGTPLRPPPPPLPAMGPPPPAPPLPAPPPPPPAFPAAPEQTPQPGSAP